MELRHELPSGGRGGSGGRGRGRGRGRGGKAQGGGEGPEKTIPPEEQRELLKDFVKLERKYWKNLQVGDFIRYYTTDGGFRVGGVITIAQFKGRSTTAPARDYMKLANVADPSKTWAAAWETIADIYIQPQVAMVVLQDSLQTALDTLHENMSKLAAAIKTDRAERKKLEARLEALERGRPAY